MPRGIYDRSKRKQASCQKLAEAAQMPKLEKKEAFQSKTTTAFFIEPVDSLGMTLYKLVMLTLLGDRVIRRDDITAPDTKTNALHRLRISAYQWYFEEKLPTTQEELRFNADLQV